jgi:hypothetical protein
VNMVVRVIMSLYGFLLLVVPAYANWAMLSSGYTEWWSLLAANLGSGLFWVFSGGCFFLAFSGPPRSPSRPPEKKVQTVEHWLL